MKNLLFAITPEKSLFSELSITLLRITFGLMLAGLHGLAKIPPSDQFIGGVEAMGFPIPTLFAWLAAQAELLGGIFLAIGFLTRPSAFFIAFTMLVAVFGKHLTDPWKVKELAFVYLCIAIVFIVRGAGKLSIDRFIK